MKNESNGLIDRDTILCHARALLAKDSYTHEDSARVSGLLGLAERLTPLSEKRIARTENRALASFLRSNNNRTFSQVPEAERRELDESGLPSASIPTSILVPQDYGDRFNVALKAYDRLFDPGVTNHITASPGKPLPLPIIDDTSASAVIVAEGTQDGAEQDPAFSAVTLAAAPTWRTNEIKVSTELLQDSGFDLESLLTDAFAVRLARGAGASLVSTLLTSAPVSVTAAGSSKNTGGSETGGTSIGWTDLVNLRTSINPAYRSGRAWFVMNDDTLSFLDSILDKQGMPVFNPCYDAEGNRILLGYPVAISPSMPSIGLNNKPIAFGAMDRFAVRRGPLAVNRLWEKYAEYGVVAFRAFSRANATLLIPSGGDSPIKVLQNAAS